MGKILCWLGRHAWRFESGRWVIEKKYAITHRACSRCGLNQEIGHDHTFGMRFLEKEWKASADKKDTV